MPGTLVVQNIQDDKCPKPIMYFILKVTEKSLHYRVLNPYSTGRWFSGSTAHDGWDKWYQDEICSSGSVIKFIFPRGGQRKL